MTGSPAETVRRGAEKMRKLATAATPGPWRNHDTYVPAGGYTATVLVGEGNDTKPLAWVPSFSSDPSVIDRQAWPDAVYIAAMDPDVALLIADQWDAVADDLDDRDAWLTEEPVWRDGTRAVCYGENSFDPAASRAVAAALKLLGEEAA